MTNTVTLPNGLEVKIARRGDQPAWVDGGEAVMACIPNHPKEILYIRIEDLPF